MSGQIRTAQFDSATIRKVAVEANCDPRTVVRRLTGLRVAGVCALRIDAALQGLGLVARETKAEAA